MKYFYTALFVIAMFMGCSSSVEEGPTGKDGDGANGANGNGANLATGGNVDRHLALTQYLANELLNPQVLKMNEAVRGVRDTLEIACSIEPRSLDQLQQQWWEAMEAFHFTEVFLYGPILLDANDLGDTNLAKDMLYSMLDPSLQAPAIDSEIQKAADRPDNYRPRKKKSIIGFDALEYVLFAKMGGATELTPASPECVYLNFVANDLTQRVEQVAFGWKTLLIDELPTPNGQTKGLYYLDRLTKGMITFTDKGLKSRKLAIPLGIPVDNNQPFPCEQGVDCHTRYGEHPYSGLGREAVISNLRAWELAFSGGAADGGYGYNGFLQDSGAILSGAASVLGDSDLSSYWQRLPANQDYYAVMADFDGNESSDNVVFAGFNLVKSVTDWLKTDFIVDMNLELPGSVQGDND